MILLICSVIMIIDSHVHVNVLYSVYVLNQFSFFQSVIVKSIEQNIECVYEARKQLIDIINCPAIINNDSSSSPTLPAVSSGQSWSALMEKEEEEEKIKSD